MNNSNISVIFISKFKIQKFSNQFKTLQMIIIHFYSFSHFISLASIIKCLECLENKSSTTSAIASTAGTTASARTRRRTKRTGSRMHRSAIGWAAIRQPPSTISRVMILASEMAERTYMPPIPSDLTSKPRRMKQL